MTQNPQPSNKAAWFSHVEEQAKGGLNCTEYCRQHGLNKDRYFYYVKLFRNQNKKPESTPSFTPIIPSLSAQIASHEVRIELPNGFRCYIPKQFDPSQIKHLIGILLSC